MSNQIQKDGYTLIEVLIALTIFAILATITSSVMYHAFNTRSRLAQQAEQLSQLQLAITLITRDTQQVVARPVRNNESQLSEIIIGQPYYFELTRGGIANPNSEKKQSTLQRVAFICHHHKLLRRTWDSLDTPYKNHYKDNVLLNHLRRCQFAYLNHNLQVLPQWRQNALQQNQQEEIFPKAIQFRLALKDWGEASFLFILPPALYHER